MEWDTDISVSVSHSISYQTISLKYHQVPSKSFFVYFCQSYLSAFFFFFFNWELLVRYTFPCTARTKSVIHQDCMHDSSFTVSQVILYFPWSVQVLLFSTILILWTACLWTLCRNGAEILPSKTPLPSIVYSSFPRPPNMLNKPFLELNLYEYSIWVAKGIQQPRFFIHTCNRRVQTNAFLVKQKNSAQVKQ